jgi:DNA-binding XRE family transcriptional regulator
MSGEDLPILPGFREMAQRRRERLAELVAYRRAAGLSQSQVADRMGISQPAVARLEPARSMPGCPPCSGTRRRSRRAGMYRRGRRSEST